MERATVIRALSKASVCLELNTGAVVQAQLTTPLSPRTHVKAQKVNAFACIPAMVSLGPYDLGQHCFTQCVVDAHWPDAAYSRLDYVQRSKKNN